MVLSLVGASACATGDEFGNGSGPNIGPDQTSTSAAVTTTGSPPVTTGGDSMSSIGSADSGSAEGPAAPPDLGVCDDDGDCVLSGSLCFQPLGRCEAGSCKFDAKVPGAPCDDEDPCTEDDMCDGFGACFGNDIECTAPNASGGTCVDGVCTGQSCQAGWGDCDGDPANGCETSLDSEDHCGACGEPCSAGANATADCSTGTCQRSCIDPWENCDESWQNGCEIPTGVANQCDVNGLNALDGCWTAHCGSSNNANAVNFGTWFCFECTTCNTPGAGQCQWCSHDVGRWYPADSCACGNYENLTCNP